MSEGHALIFARARAPHRPHGDAGIAAAWRKRPEDTEAYDCLLRGLEFHRLGGVTKHNSREAVKWFDPAIEADPNFGIAYAWRVCSASWLPDFNYEKGFEYA